MDRKIRIIIVDNFEAIRTGLRCLLLRSADKFEVIADAANGFAAIDRTRALRPEIIVMDADIQGMDGMTATRAIKSDFPDVKVLMYSGQSSAEEALAAFAAGADGYCLKGNSQEFLLKALDAISKGIGWIDPPLATNVFDYCAVATDETSTKAENNVSLKLLLRKIPRIDILDDQQSAD